MTHGKRYFPQLRGLLCGVVLMNVAQACSETPAEPEPPATHEELMGQGEAMVENLCLACHALTTDQESPHPDAFALSQLSQRLTLDELRTDLSDGILVDHPDMPDWWFEPHHTDALIYYLKSIQSN